MLRLGICTGSAGFRLWDGVTFKVMLNRLALLSARSETLNNSVVVKLPSAYAKDNESKHPRKV